MCNWKKWIWPGILAVVVLTALSTWFKADIIQNDLTEKAMNDLASEHSWASVELDGRDLTLKGVAPSPEAPAAALQIADNAYDVRVVKDATEILALADPFKLSAVKADDRLTLSGFVPDDATRDSLVDAAKAAAPSAEIVDEMKIARGAPDGFGELGAFSLARLTGLTTGKFDLTNTSLDISGVAAGLDEYDAVTAALGGSLPAGGNVANQEITPPTVSPYAWKADYDGKSVVLSGLAPNADAKAAIGDAMKAQLPDAEVTNNLRIAEGAPAEFKSATDYAAGFFPSFSQGRASYEDAAFSISGVAKSSSDFESAIARVAELPEGYTLAENSIQPIGVSPFNWSAEKNGNSIILDGYAPSTDARDKVVADAKTLSPDADIVDQIEIAGGATEQYSAATDFSLGILPRFRNGKAKLVDNFLSISGETDNLDDYNAAIAAVASGVDGVAVNGDITPPAASPYRWSVSKTANGNVVRGNAANAEDALAAVELAKASIGEDVTDKQTIASGQPEGFAAARQAVSGFIGRLEAGQGNIVDKSISVTGRASSQSIAKFIDIQLKADAPEGYTATSNILWPVEAVEAPEPPVADPYRWSVSKLPTGVTVLGNVADEADKMVAVELAKKTLGVGEVTDKQVVARGKPDGFDAARELITSQVRFLEAGQGNIIGNKISVTGRAKNENIRNLIDRAITGRAPEGFTGSTNIVFPKTEPVIAKPVEVLPPVADPYRWSVTKNASGVTVRGNIADEATRTANIDLVKSRLGVSEVTDKQIIARGKPEGFDAARELVIGQVRYLEAGQGNVVDQSLSVSGRAKNENIKNLVDRIVSKRTPDGYNGSTNITFPKSEVIKGGEVEFKPQVTAEACQAAIVAAVDGRKIQFQTARAVILPESEPVLKAVLAAAAKCPALRLQIAGHTDSRGRDAYNQGLSEARAASVVEYLSANGMDASRLEAKGFGETQPIGDNGTAEGRAQNRRIDFNVLK